MMSDSSTSAPSNSHLPIVPTTNGIQAGILDSIAMIFLGESSPQDHPPPHKLIQMTPLKLFFGFIPILLAVFVQSRYKMELEWRYMIGAVRTLLQLVFCGLILAPVFSIGEHYPIVVVVYVQLMTLLATYESTKNPKYTFDGIFIFVWLALTCAVVLVGCFAFAVVLQPDPVWSPRYVIPITGMLLGNSVSATGLALRELLTNLVEHKASVEIALAFGATVDEAVLPLARSCMRTAVTPTLNTMMVIGLVAIPGMMTGQILGGAKPLEAALYAWMRWDPVGPSATMVP